jgi:hypothetical protein
MSSMFGVYSSQSFNVLNGLLTCYSQKLFVIYYLKTGWHLISPFRMAKYVLERLKCVLIFPDLKNLRTLWKSIADELRRWLPCLGPQIFVFESWASCVVTPEVLWLFRLCVFLCLLSRRNTRVIGIVFNLFCCFFTYLLPFFVFIHFVHYFFLTHFFSFFFLAH